MKTILVTTSVVALLATMSIALAQTPKGEQGQKETSPPAVKEGAPAEKDAPKSGEKKETPDKKKATKETTKDAPKAAKEEKKEPTEKKAAKETTKDAPKEVAKEPGKDGKADAKGRTGAVTTLAQEQRTKVQTSFAKHKVKSANVNITINVGVAVPRTVELYSVPEDIIVIVPGYRRYRYFVIGDPDRICIVDPETYEIVEIIVIA
jgi:outer membrane biosynthesis protein TonB